MTIQDFAQAVPGCLSLCKSPQTRKGNQQVAEMFISFVSGEYGDGEITPRMVLEFRQSLRGLSQNTISQYLRRLHAMLEAMLEAGLVEGENPVARRLIPRERYQAYNGLLTQADLQRIFRDECPQIMRRPVYVRCRAMTLLFLGSGVRLSELLALTPNDLDWGAELAVIRHGKGDKRRAVPFPQFVQGAVRAYMEQVRKNIPDTEPLFLKVNRDGQYKPLAERTARQNIYDYIEAMTGRTDVSPHDLRHSAASHWVSTEKVSMKEIQTILGHTSIVTTERYASLVSPDLAPVRAANRAMSQMFGDMVSI